VAKKKRSAKQKANDRRLGRAAKARSKKSRPKRRAAKRKAPKRKRSKRKVNKKKTKRKSVAGKGVFKKLTGNPTLKKVLMAAGAVTIATSVAALVAPQFVPTLQKPIVKAALGFVAGDIVGAASNFVLAGGGANILGGRIGGADGTPIRSMGGNGFA